VVKSYGYGFWRPAGDLVTVLEYLDAWSVDEIVVLDISRVGTLNEEVLSGLYEAKISTPLVYGGGIRTLEDVRRLLDSGCDRFVLETLLWSAPKVVRQIADVVGDQALIASLPARVLENGELSLQRVDSSTNELVPIGMALTDFVDTVASLPVSEIMLIDADNEGNYGKFMLTEHAQAFAGLAKGIIWFGGIADHQALELLQLDETVAIAFGNINYERELFIHHLRAQITKETDVQLVRRSVPV
jgi:cyclase